MRFSVLPALVAVFSFVWVAKAQSSPIIAQYWPAYNSEVQPPSAVPFNYSAISYYFVTITTASGFQVPADQSTSDIQQFVSLAKAAGSKPVFSIGGWSGSLHFSNLVNSDAARTKLANDIKAFMDQLHLTSVTSTPKDWEYPNGEGIGCNARSPDDSANLLAFLKVLRQTIGSSNLITAAVSTAGFLLRKALIFTLPFVASALSPFLFYIETTGAFAPSHALSHSPRH
ncbi:hypothetical protein JCM10213v2_002975 [Rhodosporidiobolus nylandii]